MTGYYVGSAGSCTQCSPGCYDCNSAGCLTCLAGLIYSSGTCLCSTGFYYSTSSSTCLSCQGSLTGCY